MTTETTSRLLTTSKAISEAIAQEIELDERVFVMGEDIGVYGGIFGATEGLLAKYGPERIMDTPISETGFSTSGPPGVSISTASMVLDRVMVLDKVMSRHPVRCGRAGRRWAGAA